MLFGRRAPQGAKEREDRIQVFGQTYRRTTYRLDARTRMHVLREDRRFGKTTVTYDHISA